MESYFALVIGLIVVIVLAMALAAYNNRAEEAVPQPQQTQQKSKSKKDKKSDKKKGKKPVEEEEQTSGKKKKNKKKNAPAIKFTWDGKVENDDESMIELLKGSANFVAQEGRNEIKKKVNAVSSAVGQTVEKVKGKASKVLNDDNEEFEYVLMKRKKVDDKTKTKKKTAAVKETTPVEGEEKAAVPTESSETTGAGKKQKGFFKRGVFQSLRDAANAEKAAKQQEEDEKQNAREKRTGKKETEEAEPAKDDKKDKPARAKKAGDAPATAEEGDQSKQQRPRREPREPREPREAPPPPPRPVGGHFEVSSLDDMLSAISTHYGPKPKQNFAKLPQPVLFRLLRLLKVRDIVALSQVNHFLSKVSRDDKLWKNFCEKDFAIKVPKNQQPSKKKFRSVYKEEYQKSKKVATK